MTLHEQGFLLGSYRLKHPIWILCPARIELSQKKKSSKIKGTLIWLWFRKNLQLQKSKEMTLIFSIPVDAFTLDLVLHFYKADAFEGMIDTPIGHLRFTGKRRKKNILRGQNDKGKERVHQME